MASGKVENNQKGEIEQHKKGFYKVVWQAGVFAEGLNLDLFDPYKDVKYGKVLDEDEIVAMGEAEVEEEEDEVVDDGVNV